MCANDRPNIPDTFTNLLPEDLTISLQVGSSHVLRHSVNIIDTLNLEPLRKDWLPCTCCPIRGTGADTCLDQRAIDASLLMERYPTKREVPTFPLDLPCPAGANHLATVVRVDGLGAAVTVGPFRSSAITDDPVNEWVEGLPLLPSVPHELPERFMSEAKRIERIAQDYYEMRKARVEAAIAQDVVSALSRIATTSRDALWEQCKGALDALRSGLNAKYVVFFAGATESSQLLTYQAGAGDLPSGVGRAGSLQFNWRKAGLDNQVTSAEGDVNTRADTTSTRWDNVERNHRDQLARGLKGGANPFELDAAFVPVRLPHGPFGLVVLGPPKFRTRFVDDPFLFKLCRDLGINLLTLYLSTILLSERNDWDKTARMTGHRVRSSIQSLKSQLWTIRDSYAGVANFTIDIRMAAEKGLARTLRRLNDVAHAAESTLPCAGDVSVVDRQTLPLSLIIGEAVADQEEFAKDKGVVIEVSPLVAALPVVDVHPVLMRYVFINLINNGIKYSYPGLEDKKRVLRIKPPTYLVEPSGHARVEVVNFGLGIKREDLNRIFNWGVRIAPDNARHAGTYGKGIGLWEARRIVEGHGGRLYVGSQHHSGEDVTDGNIQHCVTVFTVDLLSAKSQPRAGD